MEPKQENKIIGPRDFVDTEVKEINKYLIANVPMSHLQTTLPITDNPIEKTKIYVVIYRFMNGFKNYVQDDTTRAKLISILEKHKETYSKINRLYLTLENREINFGKSRIKNKLISIYKDFNANMQVNDFIDIFLVFAEKQTLINVEKVTGYNLDNAEGRDAYGKLNGIRDQE